MLLEEVATHRNYHWITSLLLFVIKSEHLVHIMNDYRDAQKFMSKVSRKFYTTIPEQNSCAHLFSYNIVCNNASRYTLFYSFFNAVMDQKIKEERIKKMFARKSFKILTMNA